MILSFTIFNCTSRRNWLDFQDWIFSSHVLLFPLTAHVTDIIYQQTCAVCTWCIFIQRYLKTYSLRLLRIEYPHVHISKGTLSVLNKYQSNMVTSKPQIVISNIRFWDLQADMVLPFSIIHQRQSVTTAKVSYSQGWNLPITKKRRKRRKYSDNFKISYTFVYWQKCRQQGNPLIQEKIPSLCFAHLSKP